MAGNIEKELAEDINDFFGENITFSEKELKNPNKAKIHQFYNVVLLELGVDVTQVIQTQMKQVDYLSGNVEVFSDIIPFINLVEAIKTLQVPGFKDFSIFHLMNPLPKPTVKYMRLMMNFIHFADQSITMLNPRFGQIVDSKQNRDRLIEYRNNLRDRINERASQLKKEQDRLANIDSEIECASADLNELYLKKEKLLGQNEKLKAEHMKYNEVYDKEVNETRMIENDVRELQNRLKEHKNAQGTSEGSSQLLSKDVLRMKASNLGEQSAELQQQLTTRQVELDFNLKFKEEYSYLNTQLQKIVELIEQKRLSTKKVSELTKEMVAIEDSMKSFESKTNNLISELEKSQESLTGLKLQWSLEEPSFKEAVNEATSKNKSVTKKFNDLMVQKTELDNELDTLNRKIMDNEKKFKAIIDKCIEKYQADRQQMKTWEKGILSKLESANQKANNLKSKKQ